MRPDMQIFSTSHDDAPFQPLQLWQGCIFVDWHGVLCKEPFWHSILSNPRHQLHRQLDAAARELFDARRDLVEDWMRGILDSPHVVARLDVDLYAHYRADYLLRRLRADCLRMTPHAGLLEALQRLRGLTLITVATDNMDCFVEAATSIDALRSAVDAIVCSSQLGVLKAEDPDRFFGPVLARHELRPAQTVLIDDSEENCERFVEWGGSAIHFTDIKTAVRQLDDWQRQLTATSWH
jgi:FMN phosphatase YigB (HAD superfamily)